MNILIGPIEPFQYEQLKSRLSPQHHLIRLELPSGYQVGCPLTRGRLSRAFESSYSANLDAVINLDPKTDVDWSKFGSQILIGIYHHERKYTVESLATAHDYDLVFCKSDTGLECFRRWGIHSDFILHLPYAEPTGTFESADDSPYDYDVAFQGNLFNEHVYEYRDRFRILRSLWLAQQRNRSIRLFIHSQFMLAPAQSLLAYKRSKTVFRDAEFLQTSPLIQGAFAHKIWHLRRPVLFWYVRAGARSRYETLRDGYNCIMYDETTVLERLESVLFDEELRRQIVDNGYTSIPRLVDEVYGEYVKVIERHLSDPDRLLHVSNRRRNLLVGSEYYSDGWNALAACLEKHYFAPFYTHFADVVRLLGSPYIRSYKTMRRALARYTGLLDGIDVTERVPAVGLMVAFSRFVADITLVLVDLMDGRLGQEAALDRVAVLNEGFQCAVRTSCDKVSGATPQELTRAFRMFRPFSGPRDWMNFYEWDSVVAAEADPSAFLDTLASYFNRVFKELCGDAAVLCGCLDAAAAYYSAAATLLRDVIPPARCDLKLAFVGGNAENVLAVGARALEAEPLNRFYTALVHRRVITGDTSHPGETCHTLDLAVFERLVDRLPEPLAATLRTELRLSQAWYAVSVRFVRKHARIRADVSLCRLLPILARSQVVRGYFAQMLRLEARQSRDLGFRLANVRVLLRLFAPATMRRLGAVYRGIMAARPVGSWLRFSARVNVS